MIVLLVLFICPTAIRGKTKIETYCDQAPSGKDELGKAVDLRSINLLVDFQEAEAKIFDSIPADCLKTKKLTDSGSNYNYYASSKDFYKSLAVSAGLDASLQASYTLGTTFNYVTSGKQSTSSKVSGISLNVQTLTGKILVEKNCLDDDTITTLTKRVLRDLEELPVRVEKPWLRNSWKKYGEFLNTFGSHVITAVGLGALVKETTFAESSEAYSQRDFQVKSCVSLAGSTPVGQMGVKACSNVSASEISKTTNMNIVNKTIVLGGTAKTRHAVLKMRTQELMTKFLDEANECPGSVQHKFRAIWEILEARFRSGDNYIRAVNLQYYYLGFLNYGCALEESGGIQLQMFNYTREYTKGNPPEFACTLASEGCHSDNDCHYRPIWCACRGRSCVVHKDGHAFANTDADWGWHGCDWKVAGSYCGCYNGNRNTRKTVWRIPSRDAPQKNASHGAHEDDDNSGEDDDPDPETLSDRETEEERARGILGERS